MRVLVACEFSGAVRRAFRERGHDAWSCDLLPAEDGGEHILDNVLLYLNQGWDLMVAHPPCTYLCNSGVRWLKGNVTRQVNLDQAADFFRELLLAPVPKICVENPIPHKYGGLPRYSQIIQPWQFGHGETKATCLWLKNLPPLRPTRVVKGREQRIWKMPPSENRSMERSRTYPGVARAMANQWG